MLSCKVVPPLQTVPPTGDRVFEYLSLQGHFSCEPLPTSWPCRWTLLKEQKADFLRGIPNLARGGSPRMTKLQRAMKPFPRLCTDQQGQRGRKLNSTFRAQETSLLSGVCSLKVTYSSKIAYDPCFLQCLRGIEAAAIRSSVRAHYLLE